MAKRYKNLDELRLQKEQLQKEVAEMEDIIKFKNTTKSLSQLTNGFTDQYLGESIGKSGKPKMVLKKGAIVRSLSSNLKNKIANKDAIVGIANSAMNAGAVGDIVQLGISTAVAGMAKKHLKSKNWKKKALGYAMIYLAPYAIKMLAKKAIEVRQRKSISNIEE
ncbi:MAG: phosphoribosyl-ATP pyrophosphatase [Flavobacteriales bacterium]|nr:MAG: phosphoribosyl-ATP pyrophosphatase [Flavobacteriales bacterium]